MQDSKIEQELRKQQRELATILQNAPDLILRIDRDDRVTFANPVAERITGRRLETIIGEFLSDLARESGMDEDEVARWNEARGTAFRTGVVQTMEFVLNPSGARQPGSRQPGARRPDDNRIWLQSRMVPERDESGNVVSVLGISRDISEQRRAELELAAQREQLQHVQRMESIGRLAGGVAHDFNNILTAISGYAQLSRHLVADDEKVSRYIGEIETGIARAAKLTHQLLLFSRKAPAEKTYFDLCESVRSMLSMLERLISENIRVRIDVSDEAITVLGDQGKIEQIIANLVINARDAIESQGSITISVRTVHVPGVQEDSYARAELAISDTGIGMDEKTKARIFEPYFTTKASGVGTGLGLAVVESIVREHEGSILVESARGIGSTFTVQLPLAGQQRGEDPGFAARGGSVVVERDLQRLRVLVVEDEEGIRDILHLGLKRAGYESDAVASVEEAVAAWNNPDCPEYCAVIADMILPDGSGLEMAKKLGIDRGFPIIFTSGYLDNSRELEQVTQEGLAFVQKPFSIPQIIEMLERELEREGELSEEDSRG